MFIHFLADSFTSCENGIVCLSKSLFWFLHNACGVYCSDVLPSFVAMGLRKTPLTIGELRKSLVMPPEIISNGSCRGSKSKKTPASSCSFSLVDVAQSEAEGEISQFTITKGKNAKPFWRPCSSHQAQEMQETWRSGTPETDLHINVTLPPLIACPTFPCVALNKALRNSGLDKRDGGRRPISAWRGCKNTWRQRSSLRGKCYWTRWEVGAWQRRPRGNWRGRC